VKSRVERTLQELHDVRFSVLADPVKGEHGRLRLSDTIDATVCKLT
jgi:hypothetical protein